jgi:hypothetical protein
MRCSHCKSENLIEGTLEGISFQPLTEDRKWLAKGVYGIRAMACPICGFLSNLRIDKDALKAILKRSS